MVGERLNGRGVEVSIEYASPLREHRPRHPPAAASQSARLGPRQLELEVAQWLEKADQADSTPLDEGLTIPEEITRRQERQA